MLQAALLLLIGAAIGAFLDRGYTLWSTRPKLIFGGGGHGRGAAGEHWHITILNRPGMFGIRHDGSTLLGRPIQKGFIVERNTARDCVARLHDKETGDFLEQLYWSTPDAHPAWRVVRDIESGRDQASLRLFTRAPDGSPRYFAYAPADPNDPASPPRTPDEAVWISHSHRFEVQVSYSYGAQTTRIGVNVRCQVNGRITVEYEP